ncbi:hypothetical protein MTQ22_10555, partial [Corynebacterium bovis]|uniref:hypothetical protein n=1 Tax=Corynebacterium bovis TaxID=36808 RepID=UPI00313931CC
MFSTIAWFAALRVPMKESRWERAAEKAASCDGVVSVPAVESAVAVDDEDAGVLDHRVVRGVEGADEGVAVGAGGG